jgi:hypothetical protein
LHQKINSESYPTFAGFKRNFDVSKGLVQISVDKIDTY